MAELDFYFVWIADLRAEMLVVGVEVALVLEDGSRVRSKFCLLLKAASDLGIETAGAGPL